VRDRSSVLDLLPETALQNGLVLPRMTFLPVANLSDVNRIGQQLVQRAPRKTPPARFNSFPRHADLPNDPVAVEFVLQQPEAAQLQRALVGQSHDGRFRLVNDQGAIADVVTKWRHSVIGVGAGYNLTSGTDNSAYGYDALGGAAAVSGSFNTAIGDQSGNVLAKYGLTLHPEKTRLVDFRRPDHRALPSPDNGDATRSPRIWIRFLRMSFSRKWAPMTMLKKQ